MRSGTISSKFISSQLRIDGCFHLSDGLYVRKVVEGSPYGTNCISDVTEDVYCPGIFRRNYVSSGIPFLGGGDIQRLNLDNGKYLRECTTPNHEELELKYGWTLVTCGGTIGDAVFSTKLHARCWASQHVMRVIPNARIKEGMLYAYLASRQGKLLLTTDTYGSVIPTLNAASIKNIPIPVFPECFHLKVDALVKEAADLREQAFLTQEKAYSLFLDKSGLINEKPLPEEYDYYGHRPFDRKGAIFSINRRSFTSTTINAFNLSSRIMKLKERICRTTETKPLIDCIDDRGFFSTGSFPRVEVSPGHGIELINQRDIFDAIIRGKSISKKGVKTDNLVQENEIIIAGVGTLGEAETFCRAVYANRYLVGKLISGEFIRMVASPAIPPGYLYTWLNPPYGFRLIRNTQTGTKLCRPIPKLLEMIPVPILAHETMNEIHTLTIIAQEQLASASFKELEAISLVEQEIDKWNS